MWLATVFAGAHEHKLRTVVAILVSTAFVAAVTKTSDTESITKHEVEIYFLVRVCTQQ